MRRIGAQDAPRGAGLLDHAQKIVAGNRLARTQPQRGALDALLDQVIFQRRLVLQIDLGPAAPDLIKRRLRDIEMPGLDQFRHLPEEEGQKQRADMGAIDIGIGHDDDLVVAQLVQIELVPPDPGAERGNQRADHVRTQHPVEARALDVQDLAAQGQHRLILARTALLGGTASRVALDDEQFRQRRVLFLTIGQLAGQAGHIHGRFAPGQLARLAGGFARQGGLDDLADDLPGLAGVFLEPFGQFLAHQPLDRRTHFRGNQLVLGLAGEFRVRHLDRQHASQAFAGIVAGEIHLLLLRDPAVLRIFLNDAGQCATETGQMGAAVALRDVVGKGQNRLVVAVIPPHRHFDADAALLALDEDRLGHDRGLGTVDEFHEFAHAAFIEKLGPQRFRRTFVFQNDADAGIQEGKLAQPVFQRLEDKVAVREGAVGPIFLGRGEKAHLGPLLARGGIADDAQMFGRVAIFEAGDMFLAIAPDAQLQPVRKRVDHRNPDPVQAARDLVAVLVELPAGMKLGHDDLGGADAFRGVHVDRNPAPVVADRDAAIGMDLHPHEIGMARQGLVDAVIDDLIDHVMQPAAIVGIADIHAGAFADRFQTLENLDGICAVFCRLRGGICHAWFFLFICA